MNKNPARRFPSLAPACVLLFSVFQFLAATHVWARPDTLEDAVERLAKKAAGFPHERRVLLVWANHAALSEQRAERLRALFTGQLESAQIRLVQGEAAPALRVAIEQTPSQIVFTASVPGEGGANIAIEEVARALAGGEDIAGKNVRLEKQLVFRQEGRVLSAALFNVADSTEKRLAVLTDEALTIYHGGPGSWKTEGTKELPAPRQPQRSARGQVFVSEEKPDQVGLLLPGRRCDANVADGSVVACAAATPEWPTGRLLALPGCGSQTWWLKGEGNDFASEDRLSLRIAGAAKESPTVAELSLAGPVLSTAAAEDSGSATVTVRNLATGNYEVYRVVLSCGD